jgi:glycosyltransferase involved in cell wall biosynthesis
MKVALVSSYAPFVLGGARNIVEWLVPHLEAAGHDVEIVYLPFVERSETMFSQFAAYRAIDLTDTADVVICFRVPAHFIRHPRKVLWFIHHIRTWYDLWDSEYRPWPRTAHNIALRNSLVLADNKALAEARTVFTNSQIVGERLRQFNDVDSEVLYPPVADPERFHDAGLGDTVVCLARLESHKRQLLLVEALGKTTTPVRLHIAGTGSSTYADVLRTTAKNLGIADRFTLENRWITDEEKIETLATSLAVAYLPVDEDSYGYPSLEASHSGKALLTTTDSGGVLELVVDGVNGYVTEPTSEALASALDRLYEDRVTTARLGKAARARVFELGITWETVVDRLLA